MTNKHLRSIIIYSEANLLKIHKQFFFSIDFDFILVSLVIQGGLLSLIVIN